jgi:hypothetical protein
MRTETRRHDPAAQRSMVQYLEALGPDTARRAAANMHDLGLLYSDNPYARSCVPDWPTRNWRRRLGSERICATKRETAPPRTWNPDLVRGKQGRVGDRRLSMLELSLSSALGEKGKQLALSTARKRCPLANLNPILRRSAFRWGPVNGCSRRSKLWKRRRDRR